MLHNTPLIATLVGGLVLAFFFGFAARKLKLSPIVGYLIAGVVVGPYTPGFVADQDLALELAEMGVIFLMFGVGLHFQMKDLVAVKSIAIPGAVAQILVATLLGLFMARCMGWSTGGGIVFGLALSVASTVVLLRALEERGILDTNKGRIAVGWLIVEDIVTVLALVLLPAFAEIYARTAGVEGSSVEITELLMIVGITLGKVAAFAVLMMVVGRKVIPWVLGKVVKTDSRELFTLAVLALALGIAYGSAVLYGVSFALGAFFAGMVLAESELSHRAAEDTLPLRDAFAVLFFVSVGMLINPAVFLQRPEAIAGAVAVVLFGKSAAAYVIVRLFGHGRDVALTISASLAQIGEFSFILIGLGITFGLVTDVARDIILATAMVTIVVNPVLFALLERNNVLVAKASEGSAEIDRENDVTRAVETDHAVVIGYGMLGRRVAEQLAREKIAVVVIDPSLDRVDAARETGLTAVHGNGIAPETLRSANIGSARCALVANSNSFVAAAVVENLRQECRGVEIMCIAISDGETAMLKKAGADYVLNGEKSLAENLVRRVRISGREG